MPHAPRKVSPRLRYPATQQATAEAAAASVMPLDELRGKSIPNKLADPAVRGQLLGLAAFVTVETAAGMVGVGASSIYELRKRDPEFEAQWQAARARAIGQWESTMSAIASNPRHARCVDAGKFMLGSHKPDVYKARSEIEVVTPDETIAVVKAAAQLARERRRQGVPIAEIVETNGHGDVTALAKRTNGHGGDHS